mmetsp:Transcript_38066/g.42514  ORF Transcript_38066/g.42514 Transcript_38066/m.42514 type:complete len:103 (+) Transcript_38066:166-474(+)
MINRHNACFRVVVFLDLRINGVILCYCYCYCDDAIITGTVSYCTVSCCVVLCCVVMMPMFDCSMSVLDVGVPDDGLVNTSYDFEKRNGLKNNNGGEGREKRN